MNLRGGTFEKQVDNKCKVLINELCVLTDEAQGSLLSHSTVGKPGERCNLQSGSRPSSDIESTGIMILGNFRVQNYEK